MWRKIFFVPITLIGMVSISHGTEVAMMRYAYQSEIIRQLVKDEYVLCETCPQVAALKRAPPTPVLSIHIKPQKKEETQVLTVFFRLDSSKLLETEKKKLMLFAKEHAGEKVEVKGYTCWLGSKEHNQKLAIMRARAVAGFLLKSGIQVVSVRGFGKCCYIDRENPEPNRRVEIKLIPVEQNSTGQIKIQ